MLRHARDLLDFAVYGQDGDVGRASDFFFDDERWTIRYLVVDAGGWLTGRTVLVSPMAIAEADWDNRRINVDLTREQVMKSPGVAADQPVSRQWESEYYRYYGWPYYWGEAGLWGAWPTPMAARAAYMPPPAPPPETGEKPAGTEDNHLRSTKEVVGYDLQASDGSAGRVEDFLVDDVTWSICHIVLDMTPWWPGGEVLIPPEHTQRIDWPSRRIVIDLSREEIRMRPDYRPSAPGE